MEGDPGWRFEETTMPRRVQVSTSMWGKTLRCLIRRSCGSWSRRAEGISVRSRMRTRASVSRRRAARGSTSRTSRRWSFQTITSWAASFS
jgi:hypothetical protein